MGRPGRLRPSARPRGGLARRTLRVAVALAALLPLAACAATGTPSAPGDGPFLIVLGIAQDGGVPQAGSFSHPGWKDPTRRRRVACLGLVDPASAQRWMIDATPDFRDQLQRLHEAAPVRPGAPALSGIFLTHAHIGHYTGLMFLGHESMGARDVPVHAMPRMGEFLRSSGPWSQLVRYRNIALRELEAGRAETLAGGLTVTPLLVPHRQEFSEVVGFRIAGPRRAALYIPDIDAWEQLDAMGPRIEDLIAGVDVAYLDGTFFANGEIPGRDMTGFPHPFIAASMARFAPLPESERAKVRFIHLNHTNPALRPDSRERAAVLKAGYRLAQEGERFGL